MKEKSKTSGVPNTATWTEVQKVMTRKGHAGELLSLIGDGKTSPLSWMLSAEMMGSDEFAQVKKWNKASVGGSSGKKLGNKILKACQSLEASEHDLLLAVGAAYSLRGCADDLAEQDFGVLVSSVLELAHRTGVEVESQPLQFLWSHVELPLVCAFQLQDYSKTKKSARVALRNLEALVSGIFDGDGLPRADLLTLFGPISASLARCHSILKAMGLSVADETSMTLEWMVRQILRLSRPDHTLLGSPTNSMPINSAFLKCLLELSGDKLDKKLSQWALQLEGKPKTKLAEIPIESEISEWGELGIFQGNWKRQAPKCAFRFDQQKFWMEVCRNVSLLEGDCTPQISINGAVQQPTDGFAVVCHENGDELEYIELELPFANDMSLQRQVLLGREEQFLIVSDVIHRPDKARIDYQCQFELANGVKGLAEKENCEIYLHTPRIQSLVLPLCLPEWKVARTDDRFEFDERYLTLNQSIDGYGLFAGVFIDLNPKRSLEPRTWRHLTVAENLEIVSKDTAVAFRVQIGSDQWVFYRSIAKPTNRSFFGQNIIDDFFFGRFESDGEVEELLAIEC